METKEKKRIDVLEARLQLLSDYIVKQTMQPYNLSFADYLAKKGITKADFEIDLPNAFKNPPAAGLKQIVAYTTAMNDEYIKQNLDHQKQLDILAQDKHVFKPTNYLSADGHYFNGDGMGYIVPENDVDNWVEAVTYDGSSEATLRWALSRAYYFINELGRQVEFHNQQGQTENAEFVGRALDDVALIIDLLTKRIEGTITAKIARDAVEERHHYDKELQRLNVKTPQPKGFFNKLKATFAEASKIVKQDWYSIGDGLKKTPKEIWEDIKREAQKDVKDLGQAAQDAGKSISNALPLINKFNPVALAGRGAMLSMLNLNMFGLATHFNNLKVDNDNWPKVLKKWSDLGGEPSKFTDAINAGKNKNRIGEGLLALVHKNADGSYNADGQKITLAEYNAAFQKAQKAYDDAVKNNKGTNIAATSIGVVAGSSAALAAAAPLVPGLAPAVPYLLIGGGTLATFIPIINSFKKTLGIKPDYTPPDADPAKIPDTGEPIVPPTGLQLPSLPNVSSKTKKVLGWAIGTVIFVGTIVGVLKYKKII